MSGAPPGTSDQSLALPAGFGIALILFLFAAFIRAPFRVEGDIAYASKAALQYMGGMSAFNSIRLADPSDLSRDVQTWLFWWPPAICAAMVLCLRAGLSIGAAARLLMLLSALSAAIGWSYLAARMFSTRRAHVGAALLPVLYVVSSGMFVSFSQGDTLVFGIVPWLFVLTLAVRRARESWSWSIPLACGVLGAMYWIKYSSILATGALAALLCIIVLRTALSRRNMMLAAGGAAAFLVPVASLWLLNQHLGGDIVGTHMEIAAAKQSPFTGVGEVLASGVLPAQAGIARLAMLGMSASVGNAVGWALLAITLLGSFLMYGFEEGMLSALLVAIPLAGLGYLQWVGGYHFVADALRHTGPYWIWLQFMLVGLLANDKAAKTPLMRRARWMGMWLTGPLLVVTIYTPWVALRNATNALAAQPDPRTGLYYPTLSDVRSEAILSDINHALAPGDLAVPVTYWLGMETWLGLPGRLMPLTNFYHPLIHTHGMDGANYFAASPFETTRPVRVVLIGTDPYMRSDAAAGIEAIKKRFRVSGGWTEIKSYPADRVEIWAATVTPVEEPAVRQR